MPPAADSLPMKRPAIPEISITTSTSNLHADSEGEPANQPQDTVDDLTPPPSVSVSGESPLSPRSHFFHTRSPSEPKADPKLLSPILPPILRPSTPPPNSPSPSDNGSTSTNPPSPTLSAHSSVHFRQPTTISLRDNHPGSGLTSLNMLSPDTARQHRRRGSSASHTTVDESTEGTELDSNQHLPLTPIGSSTRGDGASMNTAASPTMTAVETMYDSIHEAKHMSSQGDTEPTTTHDESKGSQNSKGVEIPKVNERDPIPENDMDPTPFDFNALQLASLVDPKNLDSLTQMGGIDGLIKGLGTHVHHGLSLLSLGQKPSSKADHPVKDGGDGDVVVLHNTDSSQDDPSKATPEDRKRVYGVNTLPARRTKSLLLLMWLAFKDKVLILLSIAAVVSLALGLFQDFGTPPQTVQCGSDPSQRCNLPQVDWVEGVAIVVAIVIVVVVGSLNDWQKERQFQKLNEKKEDRGVKVIRHGDEMVVNIKDVLVGDIALLEPGEVVPCDGVFLRGHNVRCDESGATGESDAIRKASYQDCMGVVERGETSKTDCFVISGSKVIEGVGVYVVIAVGPTSFNGRTMMGLRGDTPHTPLQLKLNDLAELIAKLGSAAGLILFTALMIKFFVQLGTNPNRTANQKAMSFVQILIISVTLIVVAVPEGLPLAVTLALAFATKRMTKEKLLVRVLGSCETMANASVVCTDKTGTLTQNLMSVVAGSVGIHCKFVRRLEENKSRTNAQDQNECERRHIQDFSIDQQELNSVLSPPLQKLFNEAISVNSTAFEDSDPDTGKTVFVGSKTETALLLFAQGLHWEDYRRTRERARIVQMIPFSSERKAMGIVVHVADNKWRLYVKGASELMTKHCTSHVVVQPAGEGDVASPATEKDMVETSPIDDLAMDNISRSIIFYANQSLRTIALCYREFDSWPPQGSSEGEDVSWSELIQDLTLIAITGVEDPLREGVRDAVANCHKAGVTVKMCTGDNVLTARSIAIQCGIYTSGGIIMEGPVFRKLSPPDMQEIVPRLQVLARSSPEDKKILVEKLKSLGATVGVTGDGTNDGPALKTADVGFSMGIAGTEVAKEASDIILMNDNFTSIVSAIMWGRCVNDAVRKFLQFQLSVNIAAVIITFVSSVASSSESSVLSAVQLLWINIIMDTFAALALATDPASPVLLDRKPDHKYAPLFSVPMRKQILGQSLYQTSVILIFHFAGNAIFGYHTETDQSIQLQHDNILKTLVFNIFVFSQIFNSINCRSVDNKLNVFEGITRNWYFIGITSIEIAVQVLIVFVGGPAFQVVSIGGREWAISVALGLMSIPIGYLLRLIPDELVQRILVKLHLMADPEALPVTNPERGDWNSAINLVRDNLTTFSNVRGGRLRSSSFVGKSRSARLHDAGIQLPSLLTMVPSLVASSVGAGWSPNPGSLSDPSNADPSRSSAALWEGKLQIHPDTPADDPIYKKWGHSSLSGNHAHS